MPGVLQAGRQAGRQADEQPPAAVSSMLQQSLWDQCGVQSMGVGMPVVVGGGGGELLSVPGSCQTWAMCTP